jgi:hypothetical protein
MKTKIITLILLLTGSVSLRGQSVVFVGTVASVVNSGEAVLVIEPSRYDNTGMTLKPYTAVYVYASFGNAIDGDKFKVIGDCIGKVHYDKANGALATVWGFRGMAVPILPGQTNY